MPMSNRVEELESKVAELQAAVNGLTEELVETKERVRQLEDEVSVEVAKPDPTPEPVESEGDVGAEVVSSGGERATEAADEPTEDEGAKPEDVEEAVAEDESELEEDSDIIVA
jgi:uncharacterized protein YoxC